MAFKQISNGTTYFESQAAPTRAFSATNPATDGISIKDLEFISVCVATLDENTQTLSGTGMLQCWIYDKNFGAGAVPPIAGGWSRHADLDLSLPASASGNPRFSFASIAMGAVRGARIIWAANGVGVSAGATVTVYMLGWSNRVKDFY